MTRNNSLYAFFAAFSVFIVFHACQSESSIKNAQYTTNGRSLYVTHCQNCHGAKGEGLGKLYPPLTDTEYLIENRKKLACFIRNGLSGAITVNGQQYDTEMPPNPQLSPIEIAYLLTYIGNSFGNESGIYTLEEVERSFEECAAE